MTLYEQDNINDNDDDVFHDARRLESRCSSCDSSWTDAKSTDSTGTSAGVTQEVVAASTAIMGENVVDSPTTHKLLMLKHQSSLLSGARTSDLEEQVNIQESSSSTSTGGLVSQGLDWARRQRDRRQREYLQQQADLQLRKLREAQASPEQPPPPQSIFENSTFRTLFSLPPTDHPKKNDDTIVDHSVSETDDRVISKTVSKSGGGYSVQLPLHSNSTCSDAQSDASFIPTVRIEPEDNTDDCPFLLNPLQRQQIAEKVLPRGIVYAKWKRLYSLARDGDSFDCCLRHVGTHHPTLLILTTTRGAAFGGLADAPWNHPQNRKIPQYYGGSTACLFRVVGDRASPQEQHNIQAYPWTGANRYSQLCDPEHSMLALGGGEGGFGLAVSQDFTVGSTGRSATFGNDPLCDQDTFEVLDLEIYGFLTGQF